jgi:RNA recognition motif-containing protein
MSDMSGAADASAGSKIFVGGLDRTVDEGVVRNFFSQFGPVVEVRRPRPSSRRGTRNLVGFRHSRISWLSIYLLLFGHIKHVRAMSLAWNWKPQTEPMND